MQICFIFIAIIFVFVVLKPQNIRCTFLRINGFELETSLFFITHKKGKSFISFDFQVKSFRINILVWFQNDKKKYNGNKYEAKLHFSL